MHEHSHAHTHEHPHTHEHSHTHDHEHSHEHTHEHSHEHIAPADKAELVALVKFTLEHNEHHLVDLHSMIHQLEDLDETKAAQALEEAMAEYKKGNAKMQAALDMIKE